MPSGGVGVAMRAAAEANDLEQLFHREYFDAKAGAWKVFPPHSDIREARESVRTS